MVSSLVPAVKVPERMQLTDMRYCVKTLQEGQPG